MTIITWCNSSIWNICYLSGISNENKTKTYIPSLFGFSLVHFLLLWWFFTRKDRGMLQLLRRTAESRRRLSVGQRWEGSSGSCWTQTAERLSACSLANSFADGRWSGVRLGSRGGISIDTSVEPITTKGQVQGAGPACQSAAHQQNRCMKERTRTGALQTGKGGGHRAGASHKQESTATTEDLLSVYYSCPKTRIALEFSKDIRVLMVKKCGKLGERKNNVEGTTIRRTMLHTSIYIMPPNQAFIPM